MAAKLPCTCGPYGICAADCPNRTGTLALTLHIAPVVNKGWAPVRTTTGARLVKRTAAAEWAAEAKWMVLNQRAGRQINGPFAATIIVPATRADIDARIKAALDACQAGGAVTNDKHCQRLLVEIDHALEAGLMRVELTPLPPLARAPRRTKGKARKETTP